MIGIREKLLFLLRKKSGCGATRVGKPAGAVMQP